MLHCTSTKHLRPWLWLGGCNHDLHNQKCSHNKLSVTRPIAHRVLSTEGLRLGTLRGPRQVLTGIRIVPESLSADSSLAVRVDQASGCCWRGEPCGEDSAAQAACSTQPSPVWTPLASPLLAWAVAASFAPAAATPGPLPSTVTKGDSGSAVLRLTAGGSCGALLISCMACLLAPALLKPSGSSMGIGATRFLVARVAVTKVLPEDGVTAGETAAAADARTAGAGVGGTSACTLYRCVRSAELPDPAGREGSCFTVAATGATTMSGALYSSPLAVSSSSIAARFVGRGCWHISSRAMVLVTSQGKVQAHTQRRRLALAGRVRKQCVKERQLWQAALRCVHAHLLALGQRVVAAVVDAAGIAQHHLLGQGPAPLRALGCATVCAGAAQQAGSLCMAHPAGVID